MSISFSRMKREKETGADRKNDDRPADATKANQPGSDRSDPIPTPEYLYEQNEKLSLLPAETIGKVTPTPVMYGRPVVKFQWGRN